MFAAVNRIAKPIDANERKKKNNLTCTDMCKCTNCDNSGTQENDDSDIEMRPRERLIIETDPDILIK